MNFSLFSEYYKLTQQAKLRKTIKPVKLETAHQFVRDNNGYKTIGYQLIKSTDFEDDPYNILYELCINPDLRQVAEWIGKKIGLCIDTESYQTLDVRIRIATGMLFNLVETNKISEKCAMTAHYNLCVNVRNEKILVLNEDLPF